MNVFKCHQCENFSFDVTAWPEGKCSKLKILVDGLEMRILRIRPFTRKIPMCLFFVKRQVEIDFPQSLEEYSASNFEWTDD